MHKSHVEMTKSGIMSVLSLSSRVKICGREVLLEEITKIQKHAARKPVSARMLLSSDEMSSLS